MDPLDLLPGLGQMLKSHLRESDEPRDLTFYMTMTLSVAAWFFIVTMAFLSPLGIGLFIAKQILDATSGPIETNTALQFLSWLIYLFVLPVLLFTCWLHRRTRREHNQFKDRIIEEVLADERLGEPIVVAHEEPGDAPCAIAESETTRE